jgi:D-alanyl-D-alanine carboxypeptidase
MYCVPVGASGGLRSLFVGLLAVLIGLSCVTDPADARPRKKRSAASAPASSIVTNPQYAAIVVDANTGDVLHAANADSLRHPASLTKIMTLYLLFEQLDAGKIRLDTPLTVSAHASAQAPSKLGLKPGQTITVEDAIKALVTKSANDVAVVVAEALAGSEEDFARQMTRKARALRMSKTVYRNASGLPDDEQVTTARDQALLALAIQDRFPRYYKYFSTRTFSFRGRSMANHNRLLGRVEGVDGIKTGYIRASGFNLVTSVRRGNRHIVATVLGGKSAGQRDARMRELIEARIVEAAVKRTVPKVAEAPLPPEAPRPVQVASAAPAAPAKTETSARDADAAAAPAGQPVGSTEPIRPRLVRTLSVKAGPARSSDAAPMALLPPQPAPKRLDTAAAPQPETPVTTATAFAAVDDETLPPQPPGARPGVLGVLTARDLAALNQPAADTAPRESSAHETRPRLATAAEKAPAPAMAAVKPAPQPRRSGWIIQVGAFPDENEALERINNAKSKAPKLLSGAESFTEPVTVGEKTLYRARFAGFKPEQAQAACRYLKQNDFACMAIRN